MAVQLCLRPTPQFYLSSSSGSANASPQPVHLILHASILSCCQRVAIYHPTITTNIIHTITKINTSNMRIKNSPKEHPVLSRFSRSYSEVHRGTSSETSGAESSWSCRFIDVKTVQQLHGTIAHKVRYLGGRLGGGEISVADNDVINYTRDI